MLKINDLKKQIQIGLQDVYKPAVERIFLMMFPEKTDTGDELCKNIAETFVDLTAEPMADILAGAIDYYVRNISITGTIITTGSPVTQTARIVQAPTPITAGKIPNTLGIS